MAMSFKRVAVQLIHLYINIICWAKRSPDSLIVRSLSHISRARYVISCDRSNATLMNSLNSPDTLKLRNLPFDISALMRYGLQLS